MDWPIRQVPLVYSQRRCSAKEEWVQWASRRGGLLCETHYVSSKPTGGHLPRYTFWQQRLPFTTKGVPRKVSTSGLRGDIVRFAQQTPQELKEPHSCTPHTTARRVTVIRDWDPAKSSRWNILLSDGTSVVVMAENCVHIRPDD